MGVGHVSTGSCLDLEIGSKFRIGRCKGCGELGHKVNDIAIDDNLDNLVITMTMTILDSTPSLGLLGLCIGGVAHQDNHRSYKGQTWNATRAGCRKSWCLYEFVFARMGIE